MVKLLSQVLLQVGESRRVENFGAVTNLVANTLCSLARLYGEERDKGIFIRKEISQSELAKIVGTSRKSIIQALNCLIELNLIEKEAKNYFLPNLNQLQNFALNI
jgi:CRP-like cAMP-binding protein